MKIKVPKDLHKLLQAPPHETEIVLRLHKPDGTYSEDVVGIHIHTIDFNVEHFDWVSNSRPFTSFKLSGQILSEENRRWLIPAKPAPVVTNPFVKAADYLTDPTPICWK